MQSRGGVEWSGVALVMFNTRARLLLLYSDRTVLTARVRAEEAEGGGFGSTV